MSRQRFFVGSLLTAGIAAMSSSCAGTQNVGRAIGDSDNVVYVGPELPTCAGVFDRIPEEVEVHQPELLEVSGVVASQTNPDVLWMHNDSGDSARVFAIGTDGASLGEVSLPGVLATDFEDISTGPCPDFERACLYIADTGNNLGLRRELTVYAVPEPAVSLEAPLPDGTEADRVWSYGLRLPDDATGIDVEAVAVMPNASAIIVFEKTDDAARVFAYQAPFTEAPARDLELIGTLTPPRGGRITAADIHPTAHALLVRTYKGLFEYTLDQSKGLLAFDLKDTPPVRQLVSPGSEPQGEAAGYDAAGTGAWIISESLGREVQPLFHFGCIEPR